MNTANSISAEGALGRDVALGLLGAAAFGVACAVGYGPLTMARGAWMAPALFVGGAALAVPPLYMFGALAGSRASALVAARRSGRSLAAVGTALLGLAAPAAFLSATLRTSIAPALLMLGCVTVGGAGVVAVTRATVAAEKRERVRTAAVLWTFFALALGVRLLQSLAQKGGL